ncbi:hypothetical protein [Blautia sp.]|uniref:hypothetical protein n=1 Tax=Blautia sp. TaxID=1955243 RepID=UPI003AB286A4
MAQSVGKIGLDLVVNKNKFQKQMSGIANFAKKAGKALAKSFDTKKLLEFSKQCIALGSDLSETQKAVDATFPYMSAKVDQFAKSAAVGFGMSETMAKQFTDSFGTMAETFGFSEEQAYDMGTTLTGLAGDVASFYNISQNDAFTKLKSVFTGETESLEDLGIIMTQNSLDAYAMANGWGKSTQAMSEAEKVALRYQFVQEQLSTASGDFVRTSDSWSNQVGILKTQFDNLKSTLGQGLINVLTPVLKLFNQLLEGLQEVASAFKDFTEMLAGEIAEIGSGLKDTLNDALTSINFDDINKAFKELWDALAPFANNMGEGLLWFCENVLVPLGVWTANEVVPRFLDTLAIAIDAANHILEALQPLFQWFWDSMLQPLASWAGGVFLTVWDKINGALKTFSDWCKEHPGVIENMAIIIGSFFAAWKISSLISKVAGFITTAVNIVSSIKSVAGAISLVKYGLSLLTSAFNPVILIIGGAIAVGILLWKNWDTISVKAKEVWTFVQKMFQEFNKFLTGVFTRDWTKSFRIIGEVINGFSKNVLNIWNSVKRMFGGIIDFISGVFSGDWKKAWSGIKDTFKGMWDLMVSSVKAPINLIIGAVNGLVKGVVSGLNFVIKSLNKLSFDIPDWVPEYGGKKFGFDIKKITVPQIPFLAQGGFVKANTPQLAMIGDNRHYGEIVAPEDKLHAMVIEAVKMASGSGLTKADLESIINSAVIRIVAALGKMGFFVDGEMLATALDNARQNRSYRLNPLEVI